jgi:hypothetical protein
MRSCHRRWVRPVARKSAISTRGVRRHHSGITLSLGLAASVVVTIVTGVGHATGLLETLEPISAMQLHVAAAIASIPLAVCHVLARKTVPRRTDVSRRNLLRGGVLLGGSGCGLRRGRGTRASGRASRARSPGRGFVRARVIPAYCYAGHSMAERPGSGCGSPRMDLADR